MKLLGYLSVLLFVVALCSGQDTGKPAESTSLPQESSSPETTQKPKTTPSSTTPSPDTTTPVPVTTSSVPETTTSVPVTTSSVPDTSTSVPVTTSPVPDTTTPVPVTTSPVPVTTTAAPTTPEPVTTVAPPSPDLRFEVEHDNVTCILAQMEITISVNYRTESGNKMGDIRVLNNSATLNEKLSTDCNSTYNEEPLVIDFQQANEISFYFNKDDSKITVNHLTLELNDLKNIFNDSTEDSMSFQFNGTLFETSAGFSYLCNAETKVDLSFPNGTGSGSSIKFQKVQVQSFITKEGKDFLTAKECPADDNVSDIVPIAVGCALAGLVVIVLIAYLVGRRQKRQRGYESV